MTFQSTVPTSPSANSFWLLPHRDGFLAFLAAQGYASRTLIPYRRMTGRICVSAECRNLVPDDLDEKTLAELAAACPRTGTPYMEQELAMVTRRFTVYLVDVGVIRPATPPLPVPGSPEQVCAETGSLAQTPSGYVWESVGGAP